MKFAERKSKKQLENEKTIKLLGTYYVSAVSSITS